MSNNGENENDRGSDHENEDPELGNEDASVERTTPPSSSPSWRSTTTTEHERREEAEAMDPNAWKARRDMLLRELEQLGTEPPNGRRPRMTTGAKPTPLLKRTSRGLESRESTPVPRAPSSTGSRGSRPSSRVREAEASYIEELDDYSEEVPTTEVGLPVGKAERAIAMQASKLRVANMHKLLPKYAGEADVSKLDNFINLHTKYLNASYQDTPSLVCEHLGFYLTGHAGQWFRRAEENGELDTIMAPELFQRLKAQFLGASQKEDIRARLKKISFLGSTINYNSSFRRLVDDARLAGGADPIPASDVIRYYYDGLERGGQIGKTISMCLMFQRASNPLMSLEEMMNVADTLANEMGIVNKRSRDDGDGDGGEKKQTKKQVNANNAQAAQKGGNGHGGSGSNRGSRGQGGRGGSQGGSRNREDKGPVRCYACNQLGHIAPNCPNKKRPGAEVNQAEVVNRQPAAGFR